MSSAGKGGCALQASQLNARLLGFLHGHRVGPCTLQEIVVALARLDVLNADVDALLDVTVTDLLVDDDTQSTRGNVEDDTSLSVIESVGHTLLASRVGLDIHIVTDLVSLHVGGQGDHTMLAKVASEQVASAGTLTKGVRHPDKGWLPKGKTKNGNPGRPSYSLVEGLSGLYDPTA